MTSELDPIALWAVLEEQAAEDEAWEAAEREVVALTEAQLDERLRRDGLDPEELERAALSLLEEQAPGAPVQAVAQVVDLSDARKRKLRAPLWLAAAATTAVAAGAALYAQLAPFEGAAAGPSRTPAPEPTEPTSAPEAAPDPLVEAAQLRAQAKDALEALDRIECRQLLDRARELDPAGEKTPEVRQLRDACNARTGPKP